VEVDSKFMYLVAMRLQSFSRLKVRSITFLSRYACLSKGWKRLRFGLFEMIGSVPRSISRARMWLLS